MNQEYYFKNAGWVGKIGCDFKDFFVVRGKFNISDVKSSKLFVLGLGFFKCYINGVCINPDTFLPLSSDFEATVDPVDEVLTAHRIYVPEFDITPFIKNGENVIAIHFGGGWYCHHNRTFGLPKAIYRITAETENGIFDFVSDENCKIHKSYVNDYCFVANEQQDFTLFEDYFDNAFDDSLWQNVDLVEPLITEYCQTNCPVDTLIQELPLKKIGVGEKGIVYDCLENTTGYPVIKVNAPKGEIIEVVFSEEIMPDGRTDMNHNQGQRFTIISDGKERIVEPQFTWFGFRCFEIIGNAEPLCVKVIYADVKVNSEFECSNETLNWTYKTFVHTMLCNMHTGHPSDCPHLERRGYTGDGQLTCNAVFTTMDAKAFYEKWLQDIADGQDTLSGHIQYTAPYLHSGGGPGGWGSAIVEVPYQLYKHFGEKEVLSEYYGAMRRYIDYLEAHSEFGLVTSDKKGNWCLGDWCGPNVIYPDKDFTEHNQQMVIPAAYVNTYFMVKSLEKMCEIADVIGKPEDIEEYKEKINLRKNAIRAAYFNAFDDNFIMNVQGANVFGYDIGLGNKNTYNKIVSYYEKIGCFDTGIFATDILIRLLFENGNGELAVKLLTNDGAQGFEHWRRNGATTFHEYWDSNRSRSHSHPMFGAPVAYFFKYLLGIKQEEGSVSYKSLIIEPQCVTMFERMKGSIETPYGKVSVIYVNNAESTDFEITIPDGVNAVFKFKEECFELKNGVNKLSCSLK